MAAPVRRAFQLTVASGIAVLSACLWTAVGTNDLRMIGLVVALVVILAALSLGERQRRRRQDAGVAKQIEACAAEEARFRLLAERTADMIVESDGQMVTRFVSPSSRSMLGYAPEELLGTRAADFVHPDDLPDYLASISSLLAGPHDGVVSIQRYRHRNGSYIWTEEHVYLRRDPFTQEPTGCIGSLRDISERRAVEIALRDSEAFLRSVVEASPDCVMVLSLDGEVSFISRNGLGWLGLNHAEVLGRSFVELWPAPVRPEVCSAIAAAASGAISRFPASTVSASGHPLRLDVLVTPIAGADGETARLLALSRDLTQATAAENALRQTQERYRLLAENSSDLVLLREPGPDGRVLYVSPSCRRMLGYEPEAVAAVPVSELVHPDDRDAVDLVLAHLTVEDGTVLNTHRLRRGDGAYIWAEVAFRLAERAGETVVVAALRDVTERQIRAQDLKAAKDLAERAQLAAEQASEAKSDFLAVVSHEIRTPLNSIIGFTDLMLDSGELPVRIQRHAELIRSSGSALLTVVNDLLDFSKAEAGAIELESLAFGPEALAQQCAAIVRGYAGTKALDIDVETAGVLPVSLMGDEARLRQVLLNLLNNAVKFTQRGRVTLRLATLHPHEQDTTLRFEVADTGIGIPEDKQHRLFERFSQVDTSVSRRFGGSGLGLAICKKLVDLMGGTIGVSSRDGWGSTFWFTVTLPFPPARVPVAAVVSALPSPRAGRILLVEDIDINQRLAYALLDARGHSVDIVQDGAEAVAAVAERAYDVVLMDVQMPGMDGMTATRLIRGTGGKGGKVPIVAMTANVFPEQIEAFRLAGMDDHVGKPLNRLQLYATVDRWLERGASVVGAFPAVSPDTIEDGAGKTFDTEAYDPLMSYIGRAKRDGILSRLAASLAWRFGTGDGGPDALRRWTADAHVVLSVAGMTGFAELAASCRVLQAAAPGSDHHRSSLEAARTARDAAVLALAELRRGLPTAAE